MRLHSFNDKREQLKRDIAQQTDVSRRHVALMNEMKPELKRIAREREHFKKYVSSR
jgi:tRNA-dihydrouridine synthase